MTYSRIAVSHDREPSYADLADMERRAEEEHYRLNPGQREIDEEEARQRCIRSLPCGAQDAYFP